MALRSASEEFNCAYDVPAGGASICLDEELPPMTMQVGMLCSDGVILASDRKVTASIKLPKKLIGSVADVGRHESKFEIDKSRGMAVCCADGMIPARKVALKIMAGLGPEDLKNEYAAATAVSRIASGYLAGQRHKEQVTCLLALQCPEWHLLKYQFWIPDGAKRYRSDCEVSFNWEIAGHVTNPAIFLAGKYHTDALSCDQLIPLAAYLILSAHCFNSLGVDQLEIVRCDAAGVRRISHDSIMELTAAAEGWEKTIAEALSGHEQHYRYEGE